MKKKFQWLSALALMVMSALAFVACGSDDDDDNGGGGSSDNSKIVGTWVLKEISPDGGPDVGTEFTFKKNGTITLGGGEGGTFTYDNNSGRFEASVNGRIVKGTLNVNGNVCSGTVKVSGDGHPAQDFYMKFVKKGSAEDDNGGDEPSADVKDKRMVGSWVFTMDEGDPQDVGKTITFNKNGTWTIGNNDDSGTYDTETDSKGRIRFNLRSANSGTLSGKLVLVSEGNVLNGHYGDEWGLVLKKDGYTYPSGGIKGRWLMEYSDIADAPVNSILVFGKNNEFYTEGDPHALTYSYSNSNNKLTLNFEDGGPIEGTVSYSNSGKTATFTIKDGNQEIVTILKKQ